MSRELYHLQNTTWERVGRNTAIRSTPHLPWDLSAQYSPAAPPVSAHYFTQFPRRISPNYDYYRRLWNQPGEAEGSTNHVGYGGYTRDHPLSYRYETAVTGWGLADMKIEVRQAIAARIDGWTIDMLDINGSHWSKMQQMAQAVDEVNAEDNTNFWIVFMPDGTADATATIATANSVDADASADLLADKIHYLNTTYDCLYKHNGGRLLIAPFGPELWPNWVTNAGSVSRPAFWRRFKNRLETTYSTPTDLWMCYVAVWTSSPCAPAMDSFSYGHGRWGDRDANTCNNDDGSNRNAAQVCWNNYAKPWMHWAAPMDSRPRSDNGNNTYRTWESLGSRSFHNSWSAAIGRQLLLLLPMPGQIKSSSQAQPSRSPAAALRPKAALSPAIAGRKWAALRSRSTAAGRIAPLRRPVSARALTSALH